jgi:hypothetical protein
LYITRRGWEQQEEESTCNVMTLSAWNMRSLLSKKAGKIAAIASK